MDTSASGPGSRSSACLNKGGVSSLQVVLAPGAEQKTFFPSPAGGRPTWRSLPLVSHCTLKTGQPQKTMDLVVSFILWGLLCHFNDAIVTVSDLGFITLHHSVSVGRAPSRKNPTEKSNMAIPESSEARNQRPTRAQNQWGDTPS